MHSSEVSASYASKSGELMGMLGGQTSITGDDTWRRQSARRHDGNQATAMSRMYGRGRGHRDLVQI